MNRVLIVLSVVAVFLGLDGVFELLGLPIVAFDLILVVCALLIIRGCFFAKFNINQVAKTTLGKSFGSTGRKFTSFLLVVFPLMLGFIFLYVGLAEPFNLIVGVKGGVHGYGLALVGTALVVFSFFVFKASRSND